jgi:ABC-type uncharacterized transport system auxiliary subunit
MMKLVIALIGVLVLAGCGRVHYPTNYVLNFPPPVPQPVPSHGALSPVEIREFGCPEYICEGRIVYRPSPEEVGFYEYHRWAMNPREAITQYIEDGLRARSLFQSLAVHQHGSESAYVLSGYIDRLEEVDHGRDVSAICTISAQLLDTRTRSVVWTHTASENVPVEKRDIRGIVNSLSAAARTAADRLLESMAGDLPATMAQAQARIDSPDRE